MKLTEIPMSWFPSGVAETDSADDGLQLSPGQVICPGDWAYDPAHNRSLAVLRVAKNPAGQSVTVRMKSVGGTVREQQLPGHRVHSLWEEAPFSQYCIAYQKAELHSEDMAVHLIVSQIQSPGGSAQKRPCCWVQKSRPDTLQLELPFVVPGEESRYVMCDSVPELLQEIRSQTVQGEFPLLAQLSAEHPELESSITELIRLVESWWKGQKNRSSTDCQQSQRGSSHVDVQYVAHPTAETVTVPRYEKKFRGGDRIYFCGTLSHPQEFRSASFRDLESDTQLVIFPPRDREESIVRFVPAYVFPDQDQRDLKQQDLEELVAQLTGCGAVHFQCLARQGYVKPLGNPSGSFSIHVYRVTGIGTQFRPHGELSAFLVAVGHHTEKKVFLEKPLQLTTAIAPDLETVQAIVAGKATKSGVADILADWSETDQLQGLCDRISTEVKEMAEARVGCDLWSVRGQNN